MKIFLLKLTSAIVINGNIVRAGTEVELDEPTAKDLMHRGRAEMVFAQEGETVPDSVDLSKANKKTLLQIAADKGVEVPERATNKELIALIEGAQDPGGAEDFENLDGSQDPDNANQSEA